jgi:mannose-6-phosphate isomerase
MKGTALLTGTVKHYDWGGTDFIPSLLNVSNPDQEPFAEYWMGVHPQAAGKVEMEKGINVSLPDLINSEGKKVLGEYVFKRFGNLPYLLKALDVKKMLSIQVHPSKSEAEKDYARENAAGIPLDSPSRNYKDTNHKPELMVAMGEFWLLHGFKSADLLKQTLNAVAELKFLLLIFEQSGYKGLYKYVMEMPQEEVNEKLEPLVERIVPLYKTGKLKKSDEHYWAAKGTVNFSQPGKTDRGLFSVYLFNLVKVDKGEAVFQDAGVPHAYLEGQNIEIMASSDNVLRGGLTTKHIDVQELLNHTRCEPTIPQILKGEQKGKELVYKTPAPDFELSSFTLQKGETASFTSSTAEIMLLVKGVVNVNDEKSSIELKIGQPSGIVFPGDEVKLTAQEDALVFKATVPFAK